VLAFKFLYDELSIALLCKAERNHLVGSGRDYFFTEPSIDGLQSVDSLGSFS
jgi:hypothetical protein